MVSKNGSSKRKPGVNAWFGTEFNRHNSWFEASKSWIDYQRRCTVLLQKGQHVADVAYFIGEDAPKMTGLCDPPLPAGYDFDFINSDVLLNGATARDGCLSLPHGTSYRVLVLPPIDTMRPGVLRKIGSLAKSGVRVIGPRPARAPGMKDFTKADREVRELAAELWGGGFIRNEKDLDPVLESSVGGPDLSGVDPQEVLFTHRREGNRHVYFLSNQTDRDLNLKPVFRVSDMRPELWDPVTGSIVLPALYDITGAGSVLPLRLEASGSVFVVFHESATPARVVELVHDGEPVVSSTPDPARPLQPEAAGFTIACWVKPELQTSLPRESSSGISGMSEPRNEVMPAAHGDSLVPGGGYAGCGLAIGTNGVVVYEHGDGYFAPILVHGARIADWTHVALIHRDGKHELYVDGRLVREGPGGPLKLAASAFGSGFAGGLSDCIKLDRPAAPDEIAGWAACRTDDSRMPDELVVDKQGFARHK
jgi:hypothetical protein